MSVWQRLSERTLSVAAIRDVDRIAIQQFHMHSLVLMENAASACARWMLERYGPKQRSVILCGRGNNGGDGLAIARHLRCLDWQCESLVIGPAEKLSADTHANWQILTARHSPECTMVTAADVHGERVERLIAAADVVVDAMLGSGASGTPRDPFDHWIEIANNARAQRVAIDIPSGLNADSGEVAQPTFMAHATLTFVARKPGFQSPQARRVLGEVVVMPIGIPVELIEELLAQSVSIAPAGGS